MTALEPVIAVYATRYALGRRTGAAQDVRAFIHTHLAAIRADPGCRQAILRDLSETESWGDPCDRDEWETVINLLLDERCEQARGAQPGATKVS